jgi:hypothetical protein
VLGRRFSSVFGAVFYAEAGAFEHDAVAVVEEAVEHGGGDSGVAVEDGGPLLEGLVGGQDDGTAFVAGADDLEEQVGSALVDGQVSDFVEDEQGGVGVSEQFGFEGAFGLGGVEGGLLGGLTGIEDGFFAETVAQDSGLEVVDEDDAGREGVEFSGALVGAAAREGFERGVFGDGFEIDA